MLNRWRAGSIYKDLRLAGRRSYIHQLQEEIRTSRYFVREIKVKAEIRHASRRGIDLVGSAQFDHLEVSSFGIRLGVFECAVAGTCNIHFFKRSSSVEVEPVLRYIRVGIAIDRDHVGFRLGWVCCGSRRRYGVCSASAGSIGIKEVQVIHEESGRPGALIGFCIKHDLSQVGTIGHS